MRINGDATHNHLVAIRPPALETGITGRPFRADSATQRALRKAGSCLSSGSNVEAGSYIVPLLVPRDTYALFFELIAKELMAKGVPSVEAGREYIIAPTVVRALGNGDLEAGHRLLDQFVREVRRKQVDSLKNPSYHDYILADVDPEREAESLRETRRRAKETYGFSDDELDAVYGLRSRPK